ncbi:MAG: Ldh family oxidoreductase [Acidimicrobiales bacterium]
MPPARRVPVERLVEFVTDIFVAAGARREHARITAERLIEADLRGRAGHGLMRVRPYAERLAAGGIDPDPRIEVIHETPVSALVDGGNGLGPVVMTTATEIAIAKAEASGLAWVGTRRSNHAGAAGIYPAMAMRQGLLGLYLAVAAHNSMPPWGGTDKLLGTNPIAVAIPAGEEVPFQLDMATTVTSHGSIRTKALAGERLPEGWVADLEGHPITDPTRVADGYLLPIGGYKGAGLNVMIGLLAGVMNGAAFGRDVVSPGGPMDVPTNTGQMIVVARPDLFMPAEEFRAAVDHALRELRTSASATDRPVRLPGDAAAAREAEQRTLGVAVPDPLLHTLRALADELGATPSNFPT